MKILRFTRIHILVLTVVSGSIFGLLSFYQDNSFQVLNVVGFLFLSFVPGALTVLSLRLKGLSFFINLSIAVAFSLLELMTIGLLGNFLLPKLGIIEPLARNVLIMELAVLIVVLLLASWERLEYWSVDISLKIREVFPSALDLLLTFIPLLFVLQSIIGALSLNNGSSGYWALALLGEIAVYIIVLYICAKKLGENTIPIAFFFVSLSLLLMTSLRGVNITGHDIQTEYYVFQLTKNANLWNMDFYRDAYNACLSITILPTVFFNLLKIPDPYVYKVLFQFFFALCSGVTYFVIRHWADKRVSLLAAVYFFSFPTFFIDMPFLVRQEVAFLFYGLMLYVIFEPALNLFIRRWLFIIMGVGVIFSHYSTTYTVLLIFVLAAIGRPIFLYIFTSFLKSTALFRNSALLLSVTSNKKPKIAFWMIAVLLIGTFFWTSTITKTGGHFGEVIKNTFVAARDGLTENNRSTDATNLLSFRTPSQQEDLNTYIKTVIGPIREKASHGTYFDSSTYDKYVFRALPDEQLPLTKLAILLQSSGIDFSAVVTSFGRFMSKFMEILVPLGLLYLLFRNTLVKNINEEIYLIAFFVLVFIFLIIIAPVLSTEYGILRAMQQSMFIISLFIVLGSFWVSDGFQKIKQYFFLRSGKTENNKTYLLPLVLAILFFLYSTGAILQLFGKNSALLHLNNAGRYYDNYLIKDTEIVGVEWINKVAKQADTSGVKIQIQTDRFSKVRLTSLRSLDATNEIFPGAVRKEAYVFLGEATVKKERATLVFGGDQITYSYPIQFLDDNKNLVYDNGGAKIYK